MNNIVSYIIVALILIYALPWSHNNEPFAGYSADDINGVARLITIAEHPMHGNKHFSATERAGGIIAVFGADIDKE